MTLALAGCALAPAPSQDEVLSQALPKQTRVAPAWTADPSRTADVDNGWLAAFDDPTLERIVAEAIANNLDLRKAASRVEAAQQQVIVVGAQMLPQVGANIGGRVIDDSGQSGTFQSSIAYAGVAWELDVWGRLRAQRAAAQAGYESVALDYAFARQSLAAVTVRSWFVAVQSRQLLVLSERSVQTYSELLKLAKLRRTAGKVSDLDVAEAGAKLAESQSKLEHAGEALAQARRALESLLGRYPANEIEIAAAFGPLPAASGAGQPAALLERRPDLIAAERGVLAAFRNQEAARLALLPDFALSLAGGRLGDGLLALLRLNPWLATASIGMAIPIYTGGSLQAQIEIANAQQMQQVARYGSVALTAWREVEDALSAEQFLARRLPYQESVVTQSTEAVRIANVQYRAGKTDLLWVSQLQTAQIAASADLITLRGAQRINRVKLDLALGRGFDSAPAATGNGPVPGKP